MDHSMVEMPPAKNKPLRFLFLTFSLAVAAAPAGEPATGAAEAGPTGAPFELIPHVLWAQVGPLASLGGSPPEPVPLAPRGNPVLKELREKAGASFRFTLRAFATPDDTSAFDATFGTAFRAASRDPSQARAFAGQLVEAADGLKDDSGLRRLLLARALVLALPLPAGQEDLERIGKKFRASLALDVPADLTAGVLVAEALASRPADATPEAVHRTRRKELQGARLDLLRFQVRHGYLDEAGETFSRLLKEAGAEPGDDLKGLRPMLQSRLALRERYRKLLREAEETA